MHVRLVRLQLPTLLLPDAPPLPPLPHRLLRPHIYMFMSPYIFGIWLM